MRILHVVPSYLPAVRYGGPIYSVHGLASALARRGHEVAVYTTSIDGQGESDVPTGVPVDLDGVGVHYFSPGLGRRLFRAPDLAEAIRRDVAGFDVVHTHSVFLWPTTVAAAAARRSGVPYVLAPRGMLVRDLISRKSRLAKQAWIGCFERRNVEAAAAVHVTAQIEADEIGALGLASSRCVVVPNGIDLPPVMPNDAGGGGPAIPYVLFLGRLNWKKGLDRLIPAMRHVPDAGLVIAGNDEEGYRSVLDGLIAAAGIGSRVRFAGPVTGDAKWQMIRQAAVTVLPSYSENFGNVVLEAMAAACPVVVTAQVGLAEVVARAGAGIVTAGDPDALGTAIVRILSDALLARSMGTAGRRTVVENFSWASVAARMEAVYGDVRADRRRAA